MTCANDNAPAVGYCVEYKPTIWERLGFGYAHVPRLDEDFISSEGFHPGYVIVGNRIKLDWIDRLRVLLSGGVDVETCLLTEVAPGKTLATSAIKVLPPGAWAEEP